MPSSFFSMFAMSAAAAVLVLHGQCTEQLQHVFFCMCVCNHAMSGEDRIIMRAHQELDRNGVRCPVGTVNVAYSQLMHASHTVICFDCYMCINRAACVLPNRSQRPGPGIHHYQAAVTAVIATSVALDTIQCYRVAFLRCHVAGSDSAS